jgi:hypothetical protein
MALEPDELDPASLNAQKHRSKALQPPNHSSGQAHARFGITDIDSLPNFTKHFKANGVDSNGNPTAMWFYNMVGNPPELGGTTAIGAPIVPVSLDLLNYDGSVRFHVDATRYVNPVLQSPVFSNSTYSSSTTPTQISDAIQRAEFAKSAKDDWHTLLTPAVKAERIMRVPRGTYRFARYSDGSIRYVLIDYLTFINLLFPATASDTTTPIGAAENAGDITTKDLSTFVFPNTFLDFNNDPTQCCVVGFHSYDSEPPDPGSKALEKRYVVNYSSWVSPGIFSGGFADVTALSHEVSETYNDPFVASDNLHDITPWWLAPNGNCQNNLEVGDVIEGLPRDVFPMKMPNGYTYHPQNEALLQWFEFQQYSDALGGAYSYPDETTLTTLSAPQKVNCAP